MNKEKSSSSFFYYTETGEPAYRVDDDGKGNRLILVRDKRRHYKVGTPPKFYPYRVQEIIDADDSKVVFIVGDEREVEKLESLGLLATCGMPDCFGGSFPSGWKGYFMPKTVIVFEYATLDRNLACNAAWEMAQEYSVSASKIPLREAKTNDGKPFDSVCELIDRDELDAEGFLEWVYARVLRAKSKDESTDYQPTLMEQLDQPFHDGKANDFERFEEGWKPFPLDTLPFAIRKHTEEVSASIKVDPAYLALPSLVLAAGVIGNARSIRLSKTWTEPSVLFGCLVADSSTRKSPAMDWASGPVVEMDYELARRHIEAFDRYKIEEFEWTSSHGAAPEVKEGDSTKRKPAKPPKERIVISDITVETIVRELEGNPRGLIMIRDELRAWFASFGRYKSSGGGGGDLAFWLESYRACQARYDRKSGDQTSVLLPRCAVSVFGTIQPMVISKIFCREYFESGFVSRILLCLPPKRPGTWDRLEPTDETIAFYRLLFRRLRDLRGAWSDAKECKPVEVLMTAEAEACWADAYNRGQKAQFQSEGEVASMLAKMEGQCARLALVMAVCDQVMGENDTGMIEEVHVKNAVRLAEWFSHEAQRIYAFCGKTENEVDNDRIIEKIRNNGDYITARELFLTNKPKYKDTENAKSILNNLVAAGKIATVDQVPGRVNTRHTTYYTTILR